MVVERNNWIMNRSLHKVRDTPDARPENIVKEDECNANNVLCDLR
jgi:hypothetical protein